MEFLAACENRLSKPNSNVNWLLLNIWMITGDWNILHGQRANQLIWVLLKFISNMCCFSAFWPLKLQYLIPAQIRYLLKADILKYLLYLKTAIQMVVFNQNVINPDFLEFGIPESERTVEICYSLAQMTEEWAEWGERVLCGFALRCRSVPLYAATWYSDRFQSKDGGRVASCLVLDLIRKRTTRKECWMPKSS